MDRVSFDQILEEASIYAKILKLNQMEERGTKIEAKVVRKDEKIFIEKLKAENVEELSESFDLIKEQLRGIDFNDFQNLLIAEKLKEVESLQMHVQQQAIDESSKRELKVLNYSDLLASINAIKKRLFEGQKKDEDFLSSKRIQNHIKKVVD